MINHGYRLRRLRAAHRRNAFWHNVMLLKMAIMMGLLLALFLPEPWHWLAAGSANLLWLWKF